MPGMKLSESEYKDKVFACWLGKNIGGTLGAPYEGRREAHSLTYYDPVPDGSAPNDDLDFQLVWLKMLQDRGVNPRLEDFVDYWIRDLSSYPWNEYGFCRRNLERGLRPPISGCFENYFVDEMGSPIRSEIWACLAPGDPQLAAELAWMDSALDHAGGEGTCGEMFWSAVESAAFVVSDPRVLIRVGLSMIPIWSQISRVIREAVWCSDNGVPWGEARERVLRCFGHQQPCHAPQNHGFTAIGWLYGRDFGDRLCKAVNCGYDTDCTGATLGSLLGILGGTSGIPREWRDPVGERVVLHKFTRNLDAPGTVEELTEQTTQLAHKMTSERSDIVRLAGRTSLPGDMISLLMRNEKAALALARDPMSAISTVGDCEIALHYWGEPVLLPGVEKTIGVSVSSGLLPRKCAVSLRAPPGWRAVAVGEMGGQHRFKLRSGKVADRNAIAVEVDVGGQRLSATYAILGPGEAKGYPCGHNVPTCPKCHARLEACICATA